MAKFDIASAYWNVAIHPDDCPLLGVGNILWIWCFHLGYVQHLLSLHTTIADLAEWILVHNYDVTFLCHYLHDFLTLGPPSSPVCHNNLQTCVCLCKQFIQIHPDKMEGPATCLTILGIELDSETLQARLPAKKRDRIVTLLDEWTAKHFCRRHKLESLIGHLHHVRKVTPRVGHSFTG